MRVAAAATLAWSALPAVAAAAPSIATTTSCAYADGRFAVAGQGFGAGEHVALDVVALPLALAGEPSAERTAVADARGRFVAVLDTPPGAGASPAERTVRARRPDDTGTADAIATTTIRVVARGVQAPPAEPDLTAGVRQRWRLTGLPEGTRLYAHYRRAGKTVARTPVGGAADPCGRLDVALRVLPRGEERSGTWGLWMTADRTFRRPRRGVYVHRRMTVDGSTERAHVRAGPAAARLIPNDPRFAAPVTNGMAADASRIGLITLTFVGAQGATVDFLERIGDRLVRVGTSAAASDDPVTALVDATTWSCDRTERRFVATATLPGGEEALAVYGVRTPSCAQRFELAAARRAAPDALVRVRIVDRWGIGEIAPQLCVTPPDGERACRRVRLGRAVTLASRRVRTARRGPWLMQLRVGDRTVARDVVTVGGGAAPAPVPTVLATGDSTMQGIDAYLADELGEEAEVFSDVRIGTALSKSGQAGLPGADDRSASQWALLAAEQVALRRPVATVVSIGAAEGFDMTAPDGARVACCDAPWAAEYVRRVGLVMAVYARGGRVLWLTLPLPRDERRLGVTRVVNDAILAAARARPKVELVRLDALFTANGYREVLRYRGRDVDVRDADGVHLSVAGTAIAAKVVADALRRRPRG